jgi:hypothetical protein
MTVVSASPVVVAGPKVLSGRLRVFDRAPVGMPCTAGWAVWQRPAVWVAAVGDLSLCAVPEEVDQ